MIFPSEAVIQRRRSLFVRMSSGKITGDEAFRQALEADPDDIIALRFLALKAQEADDPEAERYLRDLIRRHPSGYEGYLGLAQILDKTDPMSALASGYAQLALQKMRDDDDAQKQVDVAGLAQSPCASNPPDAVTRELEPHRLIFQLCDSWDDLMDPGVVDAILRNGEACAPLLLGILEEWGQDLLTDDDRPVVERALALLGEIGDPAALPAILEFLVRHHDDLSGPADWAFRRIAWQHPEAALEKIREIVPQARGAEHVLLAHQIGLMPDVPGRCDVLVSLTEGIERLGKEEKDALLLSAMVGIMMVEGCNSPLASSLDKRHPGVLSRESRSSIRDIRREVPDGPFVPGAYRNLHSPDLLRRTRRSRRGLRPSGRPPCA